MSTEWKMFGHENTSSADFWSRRGWGASRIDVALLSSIGPKFQRRLQDDGGSLSRSPGHEGQPRIRGSTLHSSRGSRGPAKEEAGQKIFWGQVHGAGGSHADVSHNIMPWRLMTKFKSNEQFKLGIRNLKKVCPKDLSNPNLQMSFVVPCHDRLCQKALSCSLFCKIYFNKKNYV